MMRIMGRNRGTPYQRLGSGNGPMLLGQDIISIVLLGIEYQIDVPRRAMLCIYHLFYQLTNRGSTALLVGINY